jgi:hypothetical protein
MQLIDHRYKERPMQNSGDMPSTPAQPKGGNGIPRNWWTGWFKRPRGWRPSSLERRLKAGLVRNPDTGCLIWTGSGKKMNGKYGTMTVATHRLAWELANGPIPEGLQVLHRCDEPACCNPDHLYLGTQTENMADKVRKGRTRNGFTGKLKAPEHSQRAQARRQTDPQPRPSGPAPKERRALGGK